MLDHSMLVFIEVRSRTQSRFGNAASSIDYKKQQKIRKTAAIYLQKFRQHNHRICRFDTITIDHHDLKEKSDLQWIKNAF